MKVKKHYENDHVMIYVEDEGLQTCITLNSDKQVQRLGECLMELDRCAGKTVTIKD